MPIGDLVKMPLPQVPGTYDPSILAASLAAAGITAVQGAIVLQQSPSGVLMTVFTGNGQQPTVNIGNQNPVGRAQQTAAGMGYSLGPFYPQRGQWAAPLYPLNGGPGNPYAPTPILPDAILPRALRRDQPLGATYPSQPNKHDALLAGEAALWLWISEHGGLKSCCRVPEQGAPVWDSPDWKTMPSQGEQFNKPFSLPLTAISGGGPYNGEDTLLLGSDGTGGFRVPIGYDGAINRFVASVSAQTAGWEEFSGDIVWRLKINARYARNLGNIQNTYGGFETAFLVPGTDIIRLVSGQTVQVYASIPEGSPVAGGTVQAGVFGWFSPRR